MRGDLKTERDKRGLMLLSLILFLLPLFSVPIIQLIYEKAKGRPVQELDLFKRLPTASYLREYQDRLKDQSVVARFTRRRYQWLLTDLLRRGNSKVIVGRDGWLFYRPAVDYIVRPELRPEVLTAILTFHRSLKAHGIDLILVPVPVKATIYPEYLSKRYDPNWGPAMNRHVGELFDRLRASGVKVFDPTNLLWERRWKGDSLLYLPQDTHWSPSGMSIVAKALAEEIKREGWLDGVERTRFYTESVSLKRHGDLYDMLQLPYESRRLRPTEIRIERVLHGAGDPVLPDPSSPIILLGDSFTNVYSQAKMGWGDHAGFSEHLSFEMGVRLDVIAINGGGSTACREALIRKQSALSGKRLVIWQFTTRDLTDPESEWKVLEVPPPSIPIARADGDELTVVGETTLVSFVPDPMQVPYTECLTYVKYKVLSVEDGVYDGKELLAVFWGMRDSKLMPAARFKVGERHRLILEPLSEHPELNHIMRADDTDAYDLTPFWAVKFTHLK